MNNITSGLLKSFDVEFIANERVLAVLPQNKSRSYLRIQNNSTSDINIYFMNDDGTSHPELLKGNSNTYVENFTATNEVELLNLAAAIIGADEVIVTTVGD